MKCPKCNYAYVKNVGKKELKRVLDKEGNIIKGKRTHNNEKKYSCKKCGWSN